MPEPQALRFIFAGTPEFAARHLEQLLTAGHVPIAVYTQPDRPAGRGKRLTASPVKALAVAAGIDVLQPVSLKDPAAQAELAALQPELMIVVAYGLILPQAVLDIPQRGCINVHGSLLPRWRGAAPIQRAIEAGDPATGVTIMQMDAGLDTGAMLAKATVDIGDKDTSAQLHDQLAVIGPQLLIDVIENLQQYQAGAEAQPEEGSTYAAKIEKAEAHIDWRKPAAALQRQVCAFNPFPVCWTLLGDQRLKIWEASCCPQQGEPGVIMAADDSGIVVACGNDALRITRLQLPGGKPMAAADLLRSRQQLFQPGQVLGGTDEG